MTPERPGRVRDLFDRLVDLPPDSRAQLLDAECAGEPSLRRELEELLARDARTANLPVTPVMERLRPSDAETAIGPYRIERALGEGGFGEVYVAEQTHPLRRRVALKILKAGMDTKAVLARFEAERQTLALMDHPSIAKVHDAGETERGRPYFVMELVDGEPITAFADHHELPIRERLALFIAVTQAVQHAHQKGIIHRDLKPSNVLVSMVDGKPVPKVIDFGIAKATHRGSTGESFYTEAGQIIGTPEYMSPEQAEMDIVDVDTRADIYSLGVMLYELLTGSLPFEAAAMRKAGITGIRQIIRDQEAVRPSTRVTAAPAAVRADAAARRHTDPARLARLLRGDLDWIVLRAMEKDRARRYDSASALAHDIQRYLNDEPVLAGPPSASYRMGKFARRHRVALAVSAIVLASILVALFESNRQRVVAQRARAEAERARDESEAVTAFLSRMLNSVSPKQGGKDASVRDMLDEGTKTIREQFPDQPIVRARLMHTMGLTYRDLALHEEAQPLLEEALALREKALGPIHQDVGTSLLWLGTLMSDMSNLQRAESLYTRALVVWQEALGPDHPYVLYALNNLAIVHWKRGEFVKARPILEQVLELREKIHGPEHRDVATALSNLGGLCFEMGDSTAAQRHLERALAVREKILEPDHPELAASLVNLGITYKKRDPLKAVECMERALVIQEKIEEPDHPDIGNTLMNLGAVLIEAGDLARARPCLERGLAIAEKAYGGDHREVALTLNSLGTLAELEGKPGEARAMFERALSTFEKAGLPDHPNAAVTCEALARLLRSAGDEAAAERFDARAQAIRAKASARPS